MVHKQLFLDLKRIGNGRELDRLPECCECGSKYNIERSVSCKEGGSYQQLFFYMRLYLDVCIEPTVFAET